MIYSRFLAKTYHPKGCSTLVERTLQITPFFAKQTQFQKRRNWPKLFNDKKIRENRIWRKGKNKPNSNPIQSQFKANQTQFWPKN